MKGRGFSRATNPTKSTRALAPEGWHTSPQTPALFAVLGGAATTILAALLMIHFSVGLGNYVHWTLRFAAQRRLPGFADMLGVYRDTSLLWTLPCVIAGLLLLSRFALKKWVATPRHRPDVHSVSLHALLAMDLR